MDEIKPEPMSPALAALAVDAPAAGPSRRRLPAAIESQLARLPKHARGLLQIRVPVTVTLAAQRKPIQEILELGPGTIVKFDKTCNEPLDLMVGDRVIATGEVIKVGDKFGLRVGAAR
jgi:flagellar motor switch protein FliN/FliY